MIIIPLLTPNKNETREDFISRFMSDEKVKLEFPDTDQRLAVANSVWSRNKKESIFCNIKGLETKEDTDKSLIKGGYISTTHLDSGFYDEEKGCWVRDKVTKETLEVWKEELNEGIPRANKVSVNHNRVPHVAGVAIKGTARIDYLGHDDTGEEHYGLYVETLVDKTREDYDDIKFRLDNNLLDSHSIEFHTKDPITGKYMEGAVEERMVEGGIIRTILPGTILDGYTFASQPMNEHAIMIKEAKEASIMSDKKEEVSVPEAKEEEVLETEENEEEVISEEVKETPEEVKETPIETSKPELKEEVVSVAEIKELKTQIVDEFKEHLKSMKIEAKVKMNTDNDKIESKEMKEYKEALGSTNLSVSAQFKLAGKLADSLNLHFEGKETPATRREFKNFRTNGTKLEYKGLGVGTNTTDYTQSVAELSDVYDPVIYNGLNEKSVTYNILAKDDFSSKGNNQVQFTVKSVANATAGAYTGNSVSTGYTGREKNQTKFKKYQAGVEVDGDMIAAARGGPIGDVFGQEVMDATDTLMSVMNQAIFAEVGLETAAGIIGLPYLTDAAGNTTLYSLTRANFDYMDGNSGATYINASSADISITLLRQAIKAAVETSTADLDDLVFICNMTQYHKFLAIYDAIQRVPPTSTRLGFEGRASFDGVPIFVDKDCKSGSWFLVDLKMGYRIAMWVPPTLEMLGKDSDSMKGFIKTYFATYSRIPNNNIEIYGCATT